MSREKVRTLDQAVRISAAQRLAGSKPEQILSQLKRHGIGNLEDLARAVVENAAKAVQGGVSAAYDDDVPMVCYKFSSFRPVVGLPEIEQEWNQVNTVIRGGGGGVAGGGAGD
jgi:hypothetical protein